jgi:hypothetical protein
MKRSINRWTTTVATAAILGLPVVGFANTLQDPAPQQQPQPTQPQPAQPPTDPQPQPTPQPTDPQPATPRPTDPQPSQPQPTQPQQPQPTTAPAAAPQADQAVSPQEHLSQAKAAVDSIATASVPAKSRTQLAQLKRHLSALDKMAAPSTDKAAPAPKSAGKSTSNWGTEVAAIDKIITEMVGTGTTGAATPGATGTSGSSKADSAVALDDATRSKLMEVRAHITAYAAGMSGTSTPKTEAAAPAAASTASTETGSASPSAAAQPSPTAASPSSTPSATAPSAATPTTTPAAGEPAQSSAAAPAQSQAPTAGAQESAAQPQIDADAARRSLMAARESLSQLTQLPAASQLSGDARAQVAQLISNFNELITTQSNWRESYAKVNANVTALIGADNSDAEPTGGAATTATGATATPGAVGTAGTATVELDPAIRAKLLEFRHNLSEFQKASGGAAK